MCRNNVKKRATYWRSLCKKICLICDQVKYFGVCMSAALKHCKVYLMVFVVSIVNPSERKSNPQREWSG